MVMVTAVGYRALGANEIGRQNTAIGSAALESNINGGNLTAVGMYVDVTSSDFVM